MTRGEFKRCSDLDASHDSAFTLIGLLVAIVIIGILAALVFPALAQGKAQGRSTACKNS